MVLNLCLPAFHTTVECNKLCADGYDVTNLLSADPTLRRRGFKLEYFLRPPVQVTLKFGFQVELCRVDVELWSWGMDRGQVCKRLEISTSSDTLPTQNSDQGHKGHHKKQMNVKDQKPSRQHEHAVKYGQSNGQQWRLRAQQWGGEAPGEPPRGGHAFKSNTEPSDPEPDFKLVGRCELTEETHVCFTRPNFTPRPPFVSPPPPRPSTSRKEELWSRGLQSLGAVTQLRVTLPFGGSASALGLKALAVWGQPARCCPAEEVDRIQRDHAASERRVPRPVFFTPSGSRDKPTPQAATSQSLSIPEDFLDQITQEVMLLPMLLPSGVSVDSTTLEEHQKSEATWGRAPNDPFTGVPFTSTSQPLPNPQLKSRIDRFMLQKGTMRRDGAVGRQGEGENPQASRLVASKVDGQARYSPCLRESSMDNAAIQYNAAARSASRTLLSDNGSHTFAPQPLTIDGKSESGRRRKRELSGLCNKSSEDSTAETQRLPQTKRQRNDGVLALLPSGSSHEQRLSASLDEALLSALQGRPSFTSNVCQQGRVCPEPEPMNTPQQRPTAGIPSTPTGEQTCSACSCSVSVFSKSASAIYRLSCGHLLCRTCVRAESQPLNSVATSTSGRIACLACRSLSARSDVVRVHH
uniref:RING finger protein 37 isoform X2 n=1 Tax=Gasterosteus aculeatus aculeatus TaxID=481459 RepID=UPI001A98D086|nr:RING finger protein 37 isoform X2 [Gasterosteus aculeatus aculeatus]